MKRMTLAYSEKKDNLFVFDFKLERIVKINTLRLCGNNSQRRKGPFSPLRMVKSLFRGKGPKYYEAKMLHIQREPFIKIEAKTIYQGSYMEYSTSHIHILKEGVLKRLSSRSNALLTSTRDLIVDEVDTPEEFILFLGKIDFFRLKWEEKYPVGSVLMEKNPKLRRGYYIVHGVVTEKPRLSLEVKFLCGARDPYFAQANSRITGGWRVSRPYWYNPLSLISPPPKKAEYIKQKYLLKCCL